MEEGPKAPEITPLSRDARVRLAAYAGVLSAYLAAARGDPFTPFQLALFALAAAWSLGFEARFRRFFFSSPIKIGLIVVGSAIFVMFVTGTPRGSGGYSSMSSSTSMSSTPEPPPEWRCEREHGSV